MGVRAVAKEVLAKYPTIDGFFRREIWSRIHFPEMEQQFLNSLSSGSMDVAIDVGAALGAFSWILSRKAKQVYAFEPGEEHGRYLEANVSGTKIVLTKAAVGDTFKSVNMYTAGSDTHALHSATLSESNPCVAESNVRVRQVEQVTLDGFFGGKLDTGRSVDLLKVDVEGYENAVFRGAQELLARYHPLVICEIEERHNPAYREAFTFLRGLGYSSFVFRDHAYQLFEGESIGDFQREDALKMRLSGRYDPANNTYINNFVFQHPQSRIKVA